MHSDNTEQQLQTCDERFLDSIEETPVNCIRRKGHPGSHRSHGHLVDDESLAAWSDPNVKWSTAQKAARHDRLLLHIATMRALGGDYE